MNNMEVAIYLKQFPLLAVLTDAEIQSLVRQSEAHKSNKHGYVYLADEQSSHTYFLTKGAVKTGVHASDGREVIKNIVHALAVFGELGLTGEKKRTEFAASLNQEIEFIAVPTAALQVLMQQNFEFAQQVIKHLGERVQKAEHQWESLIVKDVRSRIVEFLKDSASKRGRQIGFEMLVKHALTQQDIANLVGASRQTVTAILNDLRKSNLIYFNRNSFLIRDLEKLN
jgi:CRP/FNR family transcriptional regulator, cyclic AMP receptor protein